jgi:hypothetical protein
MDRQSADATGAAYDPQADSWRGIAPATMSINQASGLWTGDEVIIYGSRLDNQNLAASRTAKGSAYDPESDTWRVLPEHPISSQLAPSAWTGREMVAWDYVVAAAAYEPRENRWRSLAAPPMRTNDFSFCNPDTVFAGGIVFAWFCIDMATFHPVTGVWSRVPNDPVDPQELMTYGKPAAAGSVVALLVSRPEGRTNYSGEYEEMWVYRP